MAKAIRSDAGVKESMVRAAPETGVQLDPRRWSAPEAIAKTYNLTPAELRVLFAIVHVGCVPETSQVLGGTENTVRTHLQRVFDKKAQAARQIS